MLDGQVSHQHLLPPSHIVTDRGQVKYIMAKLVIEVVSVPGKITLRLLHLVPSYVRWHKFGADQNLIEDTCKSIHTTCLKADLNSQLAYLLCTSMFGAHYKYRGTDPLVIALQLPQGHHILYHSSHYSHHYR